MLLQPTELVALGRNKELEVKRMAKLYQGEYKITSYFGPRNLEGDKRPHKGIDCVGLTSKNVITPTNGKDYIIPTYNGKE